MRDEQVPPTERMQRTSINQARDAFEQSLELQRNATKMFLSLLEMQDTAGRQGIEVTKSLMENYLQGVEAIMPEVEQAMEEGMRRAPMPGQFREGGGRTSGGPADTDRGRQPPRMEGGGGHRDGRMEPEREMHGGGEAPQAGQGRTGSMHDGGQFEDRRGPDRRDARRQGHHHPEHRTGEPISQPAGGVGASGGGPEGRGGREGGGGRQHGTGDRHGHPTRHEGGAEEYGRTGRWVPHEGGRATGGTSGGRSQEPGRESTERQGDAHQSHRSGDRSESEETTPPRETAAESDDVKTGEGSQVETEDVPGRAPDEMDEE
ncbi:hypothetical protein [Halovivax sp.]|uniref:hypothetical protein n=1 Tax=Halovivax sp. TaxID=1935978 RepID=UPI0025C5DBBE|nr:hypothetical protein [Halovivax sp.]